MLVKKLNLLDFYHHHHVVPLARISLTLSRHFSLTFITSGRSSGLHPISSHSCCMYVLAGCPALAWLYVGVHRSTSLMSLSLLLQQCPVCLVRLTWIVFVMGGRWPYSWCLWGVAIRTYSILPATFLCNCCLASSPAVLLVSKWCIYTAVSTRPLPGRNCVSFFFFFFCDWPKTSSLHKQTLCWIVEREFYDNLWLLNDNQEIYFESDQFKTSGKY